MAKRFGGKYSPDPTDAPDTGDRPAFDRAKVDPVGARANLMFLPAIPMVFLALNDGATGLVTALVSAAVLTGGAFMLREGLKAEAAYHTRKVARRPALPRKIIAAFLVGFGITLAAYRSDPGIIAPLLYGLAAFGLHLAAFGIDPLKSKGLEGVDSFQQDRVARVVDGAEELLADMRDAMKRAEDRKMELRLDQFQTTVRDLIRTVEEDPRDLTAARKYLGVYLIGARDATIKFADIYGRSRDAQARTDYAALLDDLEENFAARTRKLLTEDRSDLTIEIDVLRDRLQREGVRVSPADDA
ncbi:MULTISPECIES: 5-bromo-4-chloroindolyl phosphate hydrolysis family protein [Roseobacteraceae]|uniref:5-bromo-4-chloroindolyl phosphate hydrolysis family protein n=1 Tax=Roseobacteraceae TaxID=2854170 RepID=UPI001C43C833|nr:MULTISPECIES: 5-bromo-4-chloroindolyl phosphate hydrolysis family protein [Roseobacteraceae]MBV7408987.1 5-bromo-4-chloroindolyl phosphate hydrolysis family protein [Maritimibacter sp. DP1N21-5]MBY5934326.1 5-bromo-4-chloroindolyl phosphate hydrolysis family protein [Tateyamaria omphalii]